MKNILVFGDSNTWGLIPGTHERYPWGVRWTSILQEKNDVITPRIIEEGLCGRTTILRMNCAPEEKGSICFLSCWKPHNPWMRQSSCLEPMTANIVSRSCPCDWERDCALPGRIAKSNSSRQDFIGVPLLLGENVWKPEKDPEFDQASVLNLQTTERRYRKIASAKGTAFIAASDYAAASSIDDEHLTEDGPRHLRIFCTTS